MDRIEEIGRLLPFSRSWRGKVALIRTGKLFPGERSLAHTGENTKESRQ